MARKTPAQLQQAKEAKQKKLLLVLLPVFLGLAVWQGPKMYKTIFAQPAPEATPAATTTAPTGTAPGTPTAPGTSAPAAGELGDSDPLPSAGEDQLLTFSRFTARDPFVQSDGGTGTGAPPPDEVIDTAIIEINGVSEQIVSGGTFPASTHVFRLAGISADGIDIALVDGTFEGGEETVHVAVGEEIQLVADPDGTTYDITLASVS